MPSLFRPSYKIITRTDALRVFDYLSVFEVKEGWSPWSAGTKAWDDQTVFIHQWKVEAPHFPGRYPKVPSCVSLASGELVPARFSSSHRKLNSALQQTREAFANRAKPTTPMELEAYMREYSETIGQHFKQQAIMSDYNEQDGQYVWVSNGGCQICQTMEGTYATEPARPHYYCDCEISFVRNSDRENTDNNCRLAEEEISRKEPVPASMPGTTTIPLFRWCINSR